MHGKALGITVGVVALIATLVVVQTRPEAIEAESVATVPASVVFAKSLEGTTPDGVLQNVGGELVIDEGLIERFDYYLSTLGERTLPEIRKEVESALDKELQTKAAAEAKRLFGSYLDFKQSLKALTPDAATGSALDIVRVRRASILALRSRYFSPAEITALFGKEDLLENDAFARMDIAKNPSLSIAQKNAKLAELDAKLPVAVREGRAPDVKHHALIDAERTARARGATEAQILQIRTDIAGPEVAQNLAALDREEAAWKQRVDIYLAERKRLLDFAGKTDADKQADVVRLRDSSFSTEERSRVPVFE
jgi:lipase chaperone LimK